MLQYSPKIVTDSLVMCLDASNNKSYPAMDLPVKDGLALWLDASDDTTFSYSSGTSVSQWRDKSGNNRHFFQATAGNQPSRSAVVNSRKAIQFTASSGQYLRYNSTIINNRTGGSVFVVWRTAGETNSYSQILDNYHGGANVQYAGFSIERNGVTDQYYWGFQDTGFTPAGNIGSTAYSNNTTYCYWITKDSTTITGGYNGTSVTPVPSPSSTWTEDTKGWLIGSWGSNTDTFSRFFNGIQCEIIIFNRGLSTIEVKQVNTYLGQKWGISNTDRSIIDLSGNDDNGLLGNGTTANMPVYDYYNKGGLRFNSSFSNYVVSPNTTISGSQTFCVWAVMTGKQNSPTGVLSQHDYASTANFGINIISSNQLAPSIGYTNGNREYQDKTTTATISYNQIFNAVLVYDVGLNKIYWYINGVLDSQYALSFTPKSTNWPIGLGRWDPSYNNYYFDGTIFSALIYNKALSATEVAQNYEAQKSKFANTIVQQGLVLNLDVGNPYSYAGAGTTWYDVSGNNYSGSLTNGPVYSNTNGGIIVFDGSNDYVDLTASTFSISGNASRSMFAWVKTTYNGNQAFIATGTPAGSQAFILVKYGSYVGVMGYNNDFYPSSGRAIADGVWHYVGATFDGTNLRTYVDGVLDNTSGTITYSTTGQNNYVGRSNHAGNENFINGSMGNAQIYNRTLTAAEVLQNYNATKGRFGL